MPRRDAKLDRALGGGTTVAWMVPMHWLASIALLVLTLVLGGCAPEDAALDEMFAGELDEALGKADSVGLPLRFLPGNLTLPTVTLHNEVRAVFKTEEELEEALQITNPGVDFTSEWAVFYNPGLSALLPGSRARIDTVSLSQTGLTLKITTSLEHNGPECPSRSTRPFILMAVPIPDAPPPYTRRYRADRTRSCQLDQHDGVPFTQAQAEGALNAANLATADQLYEAQITGAQASILINGRTWPSLAAVAGTVNIGPITMEKLRTLGASF